MFQLCQNLLEIYGNPKMLEKYLKNAKVRGLCLQNVMHHNNKKIIIAFKKIDADVIKKIKK